MQSPAESAEFAALTMTDQISGLENKRPNHLHASMHFTAVRFGPCIVSRPLLRANVCTSLMDST